MSNDKPKASWKFIANSILERVADINLNPAGLVKDHIEERKTRPVPLGMQEAKARLEEAQSEVERAKMLGKVAKKAQHYDVELKAFAKDLKKLDASDELVAYVESIGSDLAKRVNAEF